MVSPGQGQSITIAQVPVRAAALYVPGGRAPYPSTVLMGAIPARAAGVDRVVVASPPAADGTPAPAVVAACEIAGVDAVYAIGGAQAIGALAYGTETIAAVDVIAGPGGPWVQEAKLAVARAVGTDGYAGPSEIVVVSDGSVDERWLALDICAQAEHGADGLFVAIGIGPAALEPLPARSTGSPRSTRASPTRASRRSRPRPARPPSSSQTRSPPSTSNSPARRRMRWPDRSRRPAASSSERYGATAFGDYAAGSNHVLPTGGAGRYTGPLGPGTFLRTLSTVRMTSGAAVELSPVVDEIARAEGYVAHGASARARAGDNRA